jgi:uncharacterized protein (DUF2252 family)
LERLAYGYPLFHFNIMSEQKKYSNIKDRSRILTERRNIKMARSAHAYVRGNTQKFYEWLDSANGLKVPQGPAVWICGDCHVGNLGPIATSKGKIDIQIRDLDQTVIGNPAHDLIRLGLSLASAARGSDLPGVTTAKMLEQLIEGYEQAFNEVAEGTEEEIEQPEAVKVAMKSALNRKWKQLAKERIEDTKPTIPLGKRFWPLSKEEKKEIKTLFSNEKVRRLITSLRSRDDDASVQMLDAAYWMKGCSSLGSLRYAVLLGIDGKDGEICLIDIKEAVKALAPSYPKAKMPKDNAERVVQGAWHLSPALGERILAERFQDHSVFLRELLPQDLKFEIEHLNRDEAMKVAKFLASVVGKAHARQMDAAIRQAWQKELARNRSKSLDAPSWLWSSVVELITTHEGAYLEHCRKYAMSTDKAV